MEFEQWKKALESDATIENKKLIERVKELEEENDKLKGEKSELLRDYQADMKALTNRCFVSNRGRLCVFCELRTEQCEHFLNDYERMKRLKKFEKELEEEVEEL